MTDPTHDRNLAMASLFPMAAAALGLATLTPAATAGSALNVWYETVPTGFKLTAELSDGVGPGFALVASAGGEGFDANQFSVLGVNALGATGDGKVELFFDADVLPLPESIWIHFAALTRVNGQIEVSDPASLALGKPMHCEALDFQHTIGPDDATIMQAGRVIDEQWADIGVHVSADAKTAGLPDAALLFDTNNPTGGDDDLGVNLGNALIIAENDWDPDNDGLWDSPDDAMFGGSIVFEFDEPASICAITLIDIDELPGSEVRFHRDGLNQVTTAIGVVSQGDKSVQTLYFMEESVDRLEIFLRGSGAIGSIDLIVCPRSIDFEETTFGVPLSFVAGQLITGDFTDQLGVSISAINNGVISGDQHPDKVILFDTANPTGGDEDLMTPNPNNPTNNEALGMVFIIAENDWDPDNDGIVNVPDDEGLGGEMRFEFDHDVVFHSVKLLDLDEVGADTLRFYDADGALITSLLIPNAADGSVQTMTPHVHGVRTAVLELFGSGAVSNLMFCPDHGEDVVIPELN